MHEAATGRQGRAIDPSAPGVAVGSVLSTERSALEGKPLGWVQWGQIGRQMQSPRLIRAGTPLGKRRSAAAGRERRRDEQSGAGRPPTFSEAPEGGKAVRALRVPLGGPSTPPASPQGQLSSGHRSAGAGWRGRARRGCVRGARVAVHCRPRRVGEGFSAFPVGSRFRNSATLPDGFADGGVRSDEECPGPLRAGERLLETGLRAGWG
jgi:hypothetical protein